MLTFAVIVHAVGHAQTNATARAHDAGVKRAASDNLVTPLRTADNCIEVGVVKISPTLVI